MTKVEVHHKPAEKTLLSVDAKLKSNAALMTDVQSKIKMVEAILIKKSSPVCDNLCQEKCDVEAGKMISELNQPLHEITGTCKSNFDLYTSDTEPDLEHVQLMTNEIMDVQKVMSQISELE